LVQAEQAGLPTWTSSFHISNRIDATPAAVTGLDHKLPDPTPVRGTS
jgi:hypothetical protein